MNGNSSTLFKWQRESGNQLPSFSDTKKQTHYREKSPLEDKDQAWDWPCMRRKLLRREAKESLRKGMVGSKAHTVEEEGLFCRGGDH